MRKQLNFDNFIIFDGAMGTMLQAFGMGAGELPESYNFTHPDIIESIHSKYLEAGADVITTNTFGANRFKLKGSGFAVKDVVAQAVKLARNAAQSKLVALDIGPTGKLMKPHGDLSFEDAYTAFSEQIMAGVAAGADVILIETMSDIYEAKAAVLAAKENSKLPVICTMTFQQDGRTLTGTDVLTMVNILQNLGLDALGANCSLGPKEIMRLVDKLVRYSKIPVIIQPNAGLPKIQDGKTVYEIEPQEFSLYAKAMAQKGVTILGGCCGTTPEHIRAVKNVLGGFSPGKRNVVDFTAASSYSKTVILTDGISIIGERINPSGKPKMKQALRNRTYDYILKEAIKQRDAGAKIINVNAGLPEIDEKQAMIELVTKLQGAVNSPLMFDSTKPQVLEAACRIYSGRPIINSVNGKASSMEAILPIAKKYGACVIAMTLDETGIPETPEKRLKIAEKIIETATAYGIHKNDIIVDCLVLASSAEQEAAAQTIKALQLIKKELGVLTILGVSNISFGLPNRSLLNRTFLAAALGAGLDLPIIDPLDLEMIKTIDAFNVLSGHDKNADHYISTYAKSADITNVEKIDRPDLKSIICEGLTDEVKPAIDELLKQKSPMEIVDGILIPALDDVGKKFETGEIFLPQMIMSAETAKTAFQIINSYTKSTEQNTSYIKGKILLATVRGDIHEIGKNIVKAMLENYGYEVIDLGIDVPEQEIVEKIKQENIRLVGLSALMTSSVKSMEDTIKAIKLNGIDCKVMVGGAVLNPEYANMIGADYYGKDARAAVEIAQKVFQA